MAISDLFKGLFGKGKRGKERKLNLSDIERQLIESDIGGSLSLEIVHEVETLAKETGESSKEALLKIISETLGRSLKEAGPLLDPNKQNLVLMLGVNGTGKTTTCAKIAKLYKGEGFRPLFAAGDTFRAAAREQLEIHAERAGVRILKSPLSQGPAAVIFDAIDSAQKRGENLIIADTAGRMHTRNDLMKELEKINKIASEKMAGANIVRMLVLDATTGQNAFNQAESFNKVCHIDAIVLTKTDSLAKGGTIVRISKEFHIPIAFMCYGEGIDDIKPFNKEEFISRLFERITS